MDLRCSRTPENATENTNFECSLLNILRQIDRRLLFCQIASFFVIAFGILTVIAGIVFIVLSLL